MKANEMADKNIVTINSESANKVAKIQALLTNNRTVAGASYSSDITVE